MMNHAWLQTVVQMLKYSTKIEGVFTWNEALVAYIRVSWIFGELTTSLRASSLQLDARNPLLFMQL